jgi:hypothetical protein
METSLGRREVAWSGLMSLAVVRGLRERREVAGSAKRSLRVPWER